jgi:hypothetical protein
VQGPQAVGLGWVKGAVGSISPGTWEMRPGVSRAELGISGCFALQAAGKGTLIEPEPAATDAKYRELNPFTG